ncbi:MAG: GreA/GreB family elongation factor, partial [Patescibacteria group bacterium]
SENAAYQIAKGRLRGLNRRIDETEYLLDHAIIIKHSSSDAVQLGHEVTVEAEGKKRTYQILGSNETNPAHGIISHNSPLGMALLGKRAGERATVKAGERDVVYTIIEVR